MTTDTTDAVKLAASFAGETLVPGGANLAQGDLGQAGLHLVLGFAARSLFGLPGLALVSANSLVKATTGKHLTEHLGIAVPTISMSHPHTDPTPPAAA